MRREKELLIEFKNSEYSNLERIYNQNFRLMFQYGIKFHDDSEFVKDCIQNVFFKLLRTSNQLDLGENIRFYLFKALKNTILKSIEKEKRLGLINLESLRFEAHFVLDDENQNKEQVTAKEQALVHALKTLSDRQREIIYLRYECEMDYAHICEMMNLKSDSARKLVFRAIKSLREAINDSSSKTQILFFLQFSKKYVF